jgi:glycosyltransferase involved in cell wall biosynthesis
VAEPLPLHVLLPTPIFGGHEKMLFEWLREARRQGVTIRVHCRDVPELLAACRMAGIAADASAYTPQGVGKRWRRHLIDIRDTVRILRGLASEEVVVFAPGVVQTSPWLPALAVFMQKRTVSYVPMAYTAHDMGFRFAALRDAIVRPLVRKVSLWITISAQQRDALIDYWRITVPVLVIPNRVSLPETSPARVTALGPALRVLFIGRFEPHQKGLDWLASWIRLRTVTGVGQVAFTFQGAGPYEAELRRLEEEAGPGLVSVRPWGDVGQSLAQADVLLLPSRFEGLPLVAIEAVHQGVAVIATQQAGLTDYLDPQALFVFGDDDGLARSLAWVADEPTRRNAVSRTAQRMAPLRSIDHFRAAVSAVASALRSQKQGRAVS